MELPFRRIAIGIAALTLGFTGCNGDQHPAYSPHIKYGLRRDPIVHGSPAKLGDERIDPDRPGIFPLMKMADMEQPEHPYYAKKSDISDEIVRDPTLVPAEQQRELEAALEKIFGTPAHPTVNAKESGVDEKDIAALKLDAKTLEFGSTRYRVHCLHCHGVPGDGRGPTAKWINPHPRDFRAGLFKFQSVDQSDSALRPPSRSDLMRTLRHGVEGTAMPSFNLLKDDELEALISYVIHLSVRGRTESAVITTSFTLNKDKRLDWNKEPLIDNVKFFTKKYLVEKGWAPANETTAAIQPVKDLVDRDDLDAYKKSIRRGHDIFTAKPSPESIKEVAPKIAKALQDERQTAALNARIAEAETKKRDEAKKKNEKLTAAELEEIKLSEKELAGIKLTAKEMEGLRQDVENEADKAAFNMLKGANCVSCHNNYGRQALYRFDQWGTLVRPNNLAIGNLRGGKRPVDIYYRVHSGINGSGMTGFGATFSADPQLIWDVVNFVQVMPYPAMREKLGVKLD